ncbi:Bug family tripartite tricarboxylate transporter substrate binding protein [Afifella pfennigii]|uniref:Bug family tripartite tricarboxylate transporter substrate binding protein n=1 Tax=Afifella pfennigii TaxID=209897 RepID=UPI00047A71D3|nr:tripartite tricarboxylate transporter substrate-binding protein [Afifella pfennigii]
MPNKTGSAGLRTIAAGLALGVGLFGAAPSALAWEPSEDVQIVVHTKSTGSTYAYGAAVKAAIEDAGLMGQEIDLRSIQGAGGAKARQHVAQTNAGNPHVVQVLTPSQINNPILARSDVNRDSFRGIAINVVTPLLMVVHADSPYQSINDIVAAAKEKPGEVIQGGGAVGQVASLVGKLFADSQGVDITYTPFDDEGVLQLAGGHVDFILENPAQVKKFVDAGRMRIVGTSNKLSFAPDVPTFEEAGYDFPVLQQYRGLWTSADVPEEARSYYGDLLKKVSESDSFKEYVQTNDLTPVWISGAELEKMLNAEAKAYRDLSEELNLISK